jgi:hypothetical protein
MEENYKINALNKLFTKLVIPTVNKVSDESGFEIKSIEVEEEYTSEDENYYEIRVEVSFRDYIVFDMMFKGTSNLILNAFEYMGNDYSLEIKFYNFKTKSLLDSWSMILSGDRITNSKAIEIIKKASDGEY